MTESSESRDVEHPVDLPAFQDPLAQRMVDFIVAIGLEVRSERIDDKTFVPGILIQDGSLIVDESKLTYPGDLLHEAGHLAIIPPEERSELNFSSGDQLYQDVTADAWAWAASLEIGIPPEVIFHDGAYQGRAQGLIDAYQTGTGPGVPMLAYFRMTSASNGAKSVELPMFPKMGRWLREDSSLAGSKSESQ